MSVDTPVYNWIPFKGRSKPIELNDDDLITVKCGGGWTWGPFEANSPEIKWDCKAESAQPVAYHVHKKRQEYLKDPVNHPSHYTKGKIEAIDAIESATVGLEGIEAVCTANAIKYLYRWKQKNGIEDLKKARWYINKLIGEEK